MARRSVAEREKTRSGDDGEAWSRAAVGRPRGLLTGRAVVGGFLVALAAVIVFAAALAGGRHGRAYVIAARPLAAGTSLEAGDLATADIVLPSGTQPSAFRDVSSLMGRTTAVPIASGAIVEPSMLVPTGGSPSVRPVTISVDGSSLAGLAPGRTVDVLETSGTGAATRVSIVLRGAVLIDVTATSSSVLGGQTGSEATLGVASLAEVEAVVQAAQAGTVTLVPAEPSDGTGAGPGAATP